MLDPFLRDHYFGPNHFAMTGRIYPVSIRDQMVRAEMFVERARRLGLLTSATQKQPFVVIGGGAGGATAAAIAVQRYQVPTVLIEKNSRHFSVQAGCRSRWLCPTSYDFPIDHFLGGSYPVSGASHPLDWTADWSDQLAARWRRQLKQLATGSPQLLTVIRNCVPEVLQQSASQSVPQSTEVVVRRAGAVVATLSPCLILTMTGFGAERRFINESHSYYGFEFWESDPLRHPNLGMDDLDPKVIISGSGDGGLQDFLRVATGLSLPEIVNAMGQNQVLAASRDLIDVETRLARSLHWNYEARHDHALLDRIHAEYEKVAVKLTRSLGQQQKLNLLQKGCLNVLLLAECNHFSLCFGLNRLLALVMAGVISERRLNYPILYNQSLLDIKSSSPGHQCKQDPWDCFGKDHLVTTMATPKCNVTKPQNPPVDRKLLSNLVIIRHGSMAKVPPAFQCLIRPRQILPIEV